MSDNPLKKHFRQNKISIKLPTMNRWYKEDFLSSHTVDNAIYVKAMTTQDELELNSPDALISGQAIIDIIHSCVPEIVDPSQLKANDVEALLLAIKFASRGDEFIVKSVCPQCKKEQPQSFSIRAILDQTKYFTDDYFVETDDGVQIYCQPRSFKEDMDNNTKTFLQQRLIKHINEDVTLSEDEKYKQFEEVFKTLQDIKLITILSSIEKVITPEEVTVTDKKYIEEFILDLDKVTMDKLHKLISDMATIGIVKSAVCECIECKHKWDINDIKWDPAYFFA
jgi:hypothetical protein